MIVEPLGKRLLVGQARRLLGGSAEWPYRATRRSLPAWAFVNPLAHATLTDLHRLAKVRPSCPDGWEADLRELARLMLEVVGEGVPLDRLQRGLLIPYELELLRHPCAQGKTLQAVVVELRGAFGPDRAQWR